MLKRYIQSQTKHAVSLGPGQAALGTVTCRHVCIPKLSGTFAEGTFLGIGSRPTSASMLVILGSTLCPWPRMLYTNQPNHRHI